MDNSFGSRPPWPGRPTGMPNQAYGNFAHGMGLRPEQSVQMRAPGMNGYTGLTGTMQGISTPSSIGGGYPMWDMDIPSQMFMQAVNFDRLMQQQVRPDSNADVSAVPNTSTADASFRSDAGRDLIEQHQAVEQARLLQRFKEMRQWQQQQQEVLMSQQQQQLSLLRKEQDRVHGMISKQRENQWGGGHTNVYGNTETPPRREMPPGMDVSKMLAAAQPELRGIVDQNGQHTLPKPVMYIQPKEDDDEIKTNPDLFSDTNSNRGSQAAIEDGMFPIPDSASEASVEIGMHQMRQGQVKNLTHFRQRFNPHELDAPKKLHRSFAELEHDAEFLNLSSQSPTMLEMQHGKISESRAEIIEEEDSEASDDDDSDQSDESDDDSDDDDESSEDQEDTRIEVKDGKNIDELPIKPGIEGGKTFEQLLEEQLKAEEERLRAADANQDSPSHPKRNFLKKGAGIARFESKPGQRPPRSKKKGSSTQASHKQTSQKNSNESSQNKHASKIQGKPPTQSKPGAQASKKTDAQKHKKQEDKGKKASKKSPGREAGKHTKAQETTTVEGNKQVKVNMKRSESFPDDASFVASLKERQQESERDLEELDEFEILEQFADNMSFCSNSSIVTKGLRGLQNDRILTGVVPKTREVGRPTSPRAALIKKLELEKQTKHKLQPRPHSNVTLQSNVKPGTGQIHDNTAGFKLEENLSKIHGKSKTMHEKPNSKEASAMLNKINEVKNGDNNDDDDDDYESVSDSSDDSSSDDDEDVDKVHMNIQTDTNRELNFGCKTLHEESRNKGRNDSVCSTDKKLERVLSYTGFTESSSVSQTSESEQEVNSDDDEFDFSAAGYSAIDSKEPLKMLTRKVAGRDDKNKFPFQNLPTDNELMQNSLNVSSFAPKAKSPIVISKEKLSKPDMLNSVTQALYTEETKFSYHSDSDSVGNKRDNSFSEEEDSSNDGDKKSRKGFGEKKALQFDDDEEWGELTPQVLKSRRHREVENELDKTLVEDTETVHTKSEVKEKDHEDTPPTSKLVSKLFPSLKPAQKKQEEQNLEKIQSVTQATTADGVQSKILRDKLMELEREIEKFRNENKHLATLRTEREQGLTVLKKEITEFEKEKAIELRRIEEFRNEEMKKLKHEKKMFEKYQKAARAGPDKKEREEIENLKSQLSDLQEELKRKESRWTANNSRLRDKIDQLEQENEELKEEIKLLEKKRLEWMQKDQKNKTRPAGPQTLLRSSTPTEELELLTNGHMEHGYNDLSASTTMRSNSSLKPSQHQPKVNIRSSFPPPMKQTSHAQSAQNKLLNVNQSAKSNVAHSNIKANQSKKNISHNAKQSNTGHAQSATNRIGQKGAGKTSGSVNSGKSSNSSDTKNMLRNSLAEDLPRRELGTIAEPQDLSIYSENGDDGLPAPMNLPRKFAPRPGVDKSVIDKGDNEEYDEIQHSDGKVERTYKNGAREILFSNGTRKEISADGKSIIVSFFNGDMKQIMSDQRVIYYYAENQTTHTNYPDGLEIIQFPNQQTEKLYPDGTKEITFPDQTVKYIFPNGSEESIFQDGTVIRLEKNGDKTMEFPNGQREIHTQEYKKREYPDGTVKTVYPDGRQETRYSNGRLRVKDKDGNVIVDRQC